MTAISLCSSVDRDRFAVKFVVPYFLPYSKDAEGHVMTQPPDHSETSSAQEITRKAGRTRSEVIRGVPTRVHIFGIPTRRLTTKERVEQLLLCEAENEYLQTGNTASLVSLRDTLGAGRPITNRGWGLFSTFSDIVPENATADDVERLYEVRRKVQEARGRGFVIVIIVAALVVAPLVGMLVHLTPADFSALMAPITGIAGTVIGYWFGNRGGD
ncbi:MULTISPECIES: hypothetical protein [unclassified Mycobacterium]|uniref:hypothetical protein n=1 Tax=unclassified Mycobacterium TaxID=2642494 RepID=UPI0011158720|nr:MULTISPECIES: hypothetical protein [unclassified Mycobacterium]